MSVSLITEDHLSHEGAFYTERRNAITLVEALHRVYLMVSVEKGDLDRFLRLNVKEHLLDLLKNTQKSFDTISHEMSEIELGENYAPFEFIAEFNAERIVEDADHDEEAEFFMAELCSPGTLEVDDLLLSVQAREAIDGDHIYSSLCINLAIALRLIDDSDQAIQRLLSKLHDSLLDEENSMSPYEWIESYRKETFLQ